MEYEFFEHKADAKFKAYGKNIETCFSNAALAMTSIIVDYKTVKEKKEKEIELEGQDLKSLLYNFLEELLFLLDSEFFILHKVKKIKITGNKLKATLIGDTVSEEYEMKGEVKAVTYNEMEIDKAHKHVQVIVDL